MPTKAMWLVQLLLGLALLYAAVVGLAYFAQTWLLFPTYLAGAGRPQLPAAAERLEIEAADRTRLVGLRIPAARPRPEGGPLFLGFGGNAWNAETMALYVHDLFPDGDVVAFHYRGYGPSGGRPSAAALLADSLTIFDRLAPTPVVAVGFSIGSGVAAYLARHRPLAGLILVTPFDSLEALAREHYFWAPVSLLLRHRMPTIDWLKEVRTPTALITARHDTIVPERRSAPLRRAIPNLVLDRTIEAGHNDLYGHSAFVEAMREARTRIEAAGGPPERPGNAEVR